MVDCVSQTIVLCRHGVADVMAPNGQHTMIWHTIPPNKHRKLRVVAMPTLPSLVAPQVVKLTTCWSACDDKIGIVTTASFSVHWVTFRNSFVLWKGQYYDNVFLKFWWCRNNIGYFGLYAMLWQHANLVWMVAINILMCAGCCPFVTQW